MREVELVPRHGDYDNADFAEDEISESTESMLNRVCSPLNKSKVPSVSLHKPFSRKEVTKPGMQSSEIVSPTLRQICLKRKPRKSFDLAQEKTSAQPFHIRKKQFANVQKRAVSKRQSEHSKALENFTHAMEDRANRKAKACTPHNSEKGGNGSP